MEDVICHDAVVTAVKGDILYVKIVRQSACSACHAKSACMSSDQSELIVEIKEPGHTYMAGQKVMLEGSMASGLKAVFLAFVISFALVILSLIVCYAVTKNEVLSGLISLLILLPYYFILYLYKNKLKRKFTFRVKHILS